MQESIQENQIYLLHFVYFVFISMKIGDATVGQKFVKKIIKLSKHSTWTELFISNFTLKNLTHIETFNLVHSLNAHNW